MDAWKQYLMVIGLAMLAVVTFGAGEDAQLAGSIEAGAVEQVTRASVPLLDLSWTENSTQQQQTSPFDLAGFGGGGSCYTGCFSAQQSAALCPAGQVAQATVSGPINACKLSNLRCVSSCSGPLVSCNGFTTCGF